jgi:hypothetical protein
MRRSTLRVLLTRAGLPAPRGYFAHRNGGDVRVALRPALSPDPDVAARLAARMAAAKVRS